MCGAACGASPISESHPRGFWEHVPDVRYSGSRNNLGGVKLIGTARGGHFLLSADLLGGVDLLLGQFSDKKSACGSASHTHMA